MNKNYFRFLIRERKVALIFVFVLYLAIAGSVFLFSDGRNGATVVEESMVISAVMSIMMTYALPVLLLSVVHRRRSADLYLSLPISRKEMLVTSMVFAILVPLACFAASSLIALLLSRFWAGALSVLLIILFMAVFITEMTLINSSFFLLANNIFDGIVMICSYTGIPLLILMLVTGFIDAMVAGASIGTYPHAGELGAYTSPLAMNIQSAGDVFSLIDGHTSFDHSVMYYILPAVYALLAVFLLKKHFIDRKSERAEQISDNLLSYPGVIHICLFLSMMILSLETPKTGLARFAIFYLILLFIYIVAMFVYKRSMKVSWKNLAIYGALLAFSLGFCNLAWNTRCFGLAENYSLTKEKYLRYSYTVMADEKDLGKPTAFDHYERNVDVSFELDIPVENMKEYQEVIDLLENYRQKGIDQYYQKDDESGYDSSRSYFSAANHPQPRIETDPLSGKQIHFDAEETNRYGYSISELLSEEDLCRINQFAPVIIYRYEDDSTVELDEYLERRNH